MLVPAHKHYIIRRSYASISAADLKFGQPLHETHPHILSPGECALPSLIRMQVLDDMVLTDK